MDQHAKWTFAIANLYAKWAEQVCVFFSAPFTVDEDGNITLNAEQPSAEVKAELLRDAEAHKRMAAFTAAVGAADPDAEIPNFPVS